MQDSYQLNFSPARPGMLADLTHNKIVSSLSDTDTPFGRVVVKTNDKVELPNAGNDFDKEIGVVIAGETQESNNDNSDSHYKAGQTLSVLTKGKVWVEVDDESITEGSPVFVRFSGGLKGVCRSNASNNQAEKIDGAFFHSKAHKFVEKTNNVFPPQPATTSTTFKGYALVSFS